MALPCDVAVRTGDGYYLVWPEESAKRPLIERLQTFLTAQTPDVSRAAVRFIGWGNSAYRSSRVCQIRRT